MNVRMILTRTQNVIVQDLRIANTLFARVRGLLFTDRLMPGQGLWLVPCDSIHTIGMCYPIDVIYLDRKNKIVKLSHQLRPNRVGPIVWSARSVIELPAGSLEPTDVKIGDTLKPC